MSKSSAEIFASGSGIHKINRPRVRPTRPCLPAIKSANRSSYRDVQSTISTTQLVNLEEVSTESLWKYCSHYNITSISIDSSREQMINAVKQHVASQPPLDEEKVIEEFTRAAMTQKQEHTEKETGTESEDGRHSNVKVNLEELSTESLRKYCSHYNITSIRVDSSREQMINAVKQHFASQPPLDEVKVIEEFTRAAKRQKQEHAEKETETEPEDGQ